MAAEQLLAAGGDDGEDGDVEAGPVDGDVGDGDDGDARHDERDGEDNGVAEVARVHKVLHDADEGNDTELGDLVEAHLHSGRAHDGGG